MSYSDAKSRVLRTDELLRLIFDHCLPGTVFGSRLLRSLALVCKTFKEPALDYLWRSIAGLQPILFILPDSVVKMHSYWDWTLLRHLNENECTPLLAYTSRIKKLYISHPSDFKSSDVVLEALLTAGRTNVLFPSVTHLSAEHVSSDIAFGFASLCGSKISTFNATELSSRDFRIDLRTHMRFIMTLGTRRPPLRSFTFTFKSRSSDHKSYWDDSDDERDDDLTYFDHDNRKRYYTDLRALVLPFVEDSHHLTSIHISADVELLRELAHLPHLEHLSLAIHEVSRSRASLPSRDTVPFARLQHLTLQIYGHRGVLAATRLLDGARCLAKQGIDIGIHCECEEEEVATLLRRILDIGINTNVQSFRLEYYAKDSLDRHFSPLNFTHLRLLLPFRQLHSVSFDAPEPLMLRNIDLKDAVTAWPSIRKLCLGSLWPTFKDWQLLEDLVNLEGLVHLTSCTELSFASVFVDAKSCQPAIAFTSSRMSSQPLKLSLGTSPIDSSADVVSIFKQHVPKLRLFEEPNALRHQFDPDEYQPFQYLKQWREVDEILCSL